MGGLCPVNPQHEELGPTQSWGQVDTPRWGLKEPLALHAGLRWPTDAIGKMSMLTSPCTAAPQSQCSAVECGPVCRMDMGGE